jgi:tetratricopeptide (TPR) repeat protein
MRLAVSIAAWSHDPDATLPPEQAMLPSALRALGFSVMHAGLGELPAGLSAALSGVEESDTLLLHVSGVVGKDGALELGDTESMPLTLVADVLAAKSCKRTLVMVEASYRGTEDAFAAVELVEAVADALSSHAGSQTSVIAIHPLSSGAAKLGFTRLVLDAVRDVVKPDGIALIDDAYALARERQMAGIAASGFAFLRGGAAFEIAHALPTPAMPPRATDPDLGISTPEVAAPETPLPREAPPASALTPPALVDAPDPPVSATEAPASLEPVPAPLESVAASAATSPTIDDAVSVPVVAPAPVSTPAPVLPAAGAPRDVSSPDWIEASDVIEAPSREQLDHRIEAATAAHDHRLVVELCRERLPYLRTAEARVDELFEIGRLLVGKLRDLPEAVRTLEEARAIDPSREDVLEALRRSYTRLSRWTESLEVTLTLVKRTENAHERAGLRVAAALLACEHLSDEDYALELLTLALEDDPTNEPALEEIVRIRRSRGDLVDLERSLAVLAERLVDSGDAARAWDACQRLAAVRRDDLGDTAGAVEALAIAKRLPLGELDSRAVLAEQLLALDDDEGAIVELEAIVEQAPGHTRAHARLFSIHQRAGNHDRAYLSALVLEELGDADAKARELLEAYRSEWGLKARAMLDDVAWDCFRASGSDDALEAVFRASVRAAVAAQLEDRTAPVLDPGRRQPETSTASIIRCFHWAARALGTPCPALYVLDEVKGGIAAVSAPEPTTALGPEVLRGVSSKTLAFLAGRHLTYFRPEYQVLVHFPTIEATAGLFFAAVDLVAPGTLVPPNLAPRVTAAKFRLARHIRPDELATLSAAVGRMEARAAKVDLLGWIKSVELTAGRAGLILAGDLQTALAQVRSEERGLSGLSVDERREDLIRFCASRTLADLRETYSGTTPSSMRPPSSEAYVRRDDLREFGEVARSPQLMA